jgi:hypothetical protein
MQPHGVTARQPCRLGASFDDLDDDYYVSTATAAAGIGVRAETLRRWRQHRKHLPFIVLAGVTMYKVADLRSFLHAARVEPEQIAAAGK